MLRKVRLWPYLGQKDPTQSLLLFLKISFNLSVIPNAKYVRNVSFSENFANINYSILRVHPFSTYAKISEKLTFLTP